MSSYLSKSKKDFKPKAPVRRAPAAATSTTSSHTSVRGSVERQYQTPQPSAATHNTPTPSAEGRDPSPVHPTQSPEETAPVPHHDRIETAVEVSQAIVPTTQPAVTTRSSPEATRRRTSIVPVSTIGTSRVNLTQDTSIASPNEPRQLPTPVATQQGTPTPAPSIQSRTSVVEPSTSLLTATQQSAAVGPNTHGPTRDGQTPESSEVQRAAIAASTTVDQGGATAQPGTTSLRPTIGTTQAQTPVTTNAQPAANTQPEARRPQPSATAKKKAARKPVQPKKRAQKEPKQRAKRVRIQAARQEDEGADNAFDLAADTSLQSKRKRQRREPTPEDAEHIRITPEDVTMSDLTKDRQRGKKSTREARLVERDKEEEEKRLELVRQEAQAFMDDPTSNPPRSNGTSNASAPVPAAPAPPIEAPAVRRLAPQVRLVNGQLVQDEESRTINRHAALANADDDGGSEIFVEDELTRRFNQGTHLKREKRSKWPPEETERFFEGLRMWGTDFGMISKMFRGRSRHAIKLKFCAEDRDDPEYVRRVLTQERKVASLEEIEAISGEKYRDPRELDREMEEDRRQLEEAQRAEDEMREETRRARERDVARERDGRRRSDSLEEIVEGEDEDGDDYVASAPSKLAKGFAGAAGKGGKLRALKVAG
jgi:transcription factor TFIIIB component B''